MSFFQKTADFFSSVHTCTIVEEANNISHNYNINIPFLATSSMCLSKRAYAVKESATNHMAVGLIRGVPPIIEVVEWS